MQFARAFPALALLTASTLFLASQAPTNGTVKAPFGRVALSPSLDSSCCTPTVIDDLPYVITEPGLYVLEEDLAGVPNEDGIAIQTPGVTVDLCGHEISGVPGSLYGISARNSTWTRATVRNGRVRGFGQGGVLLAARDGKLERMHVTDCGAEGAPGGPGVIAGDRAVVADVTVEGSAGLGFSVGSGVHLVDCVARNNGLSGFRVNEGVLLENCRSLENVMEGFDVGTSGKGYVLQDCSALRNGRRGFVLGRDSVAERCYAEDNDLGGFRVRERSLAVDSVAVLSSEGAGFELFPGARVERCRSFQNEWGMTVDEGVVQSCTVRENALGGIDVISGPAEVRDTVVDSNPGHGLILLDRSTAIGNAVHRNLGSGIRVEGQWARVEENHVTGNAIGIEVLGLDNLVARNSLAANGIQFVLEPTSSVGPTNTSNGFIQPQSPYLNFDLTFPTLPAPPAD